MADRKQQKQDDKRLRRSDLFLIAQREGVRRTKLHDQQQQKATSLREALLVTKNNMPDMRIAEDKMLFSPDPSKRYKDGQPDQRFLENRRDLLELHRQRGETPKNLIFTDDMGSSVVGIEVDDE